MSVSPAEDEPVETPTFEEPIESPEGSGDAASEEDDEGSGIPPGGTAEQLIEEATANMRRARAGMSLVHKEHFALLFANCLFFAGSLAAWTRAPYNAAVKGGDLLTGLGTIRGAGIFALSIYGFCVLAIGLHTKRTVVWPFLINALVGLWVGLGGVVKGFNSDAWRSAQDELKKAPSKTAMDDMLAPLGTIAPGFWLLAAGSLLVLFLIVKGIVGGASKARQGGSEGGSRSR